MLYLIQGTGLVLALITLINADLDEDCPPELNDLVLTPPELVVEYGTSFSVSCSSSNITNVTWGDELEQFVVNQAIYIDNLTDWELQPVCYMNLDGVECKKAVQMTIYKFPDLVSISTVNHTGPMTAGGQYELRCDVHNVTPVHLLTVNWYKDLFIVDSTNVTDIRNKLPDSWSTTLQISPSIEDQGVEYKCEAMLNLGPKGPAFNTYTSEPLNIHLSTQSYNCSELALDPPELVVRYGDPASVSCRSLSIYTDLGWRVPQGNVSTPVEQSVTWRTNNVTDWGIEPVCYMMRDGVECAKFLPITIYKLPDQVSISVVNHTGPLVVDKKYDLQCDIQNFAPLHVLSVSWYHGDQLLKHRGFSNISTKTPSNKTVTMRIKVRRDDVQFSCAAKLKVGPSPPIVKSNLLKISVHYKPVINCLNWSPMINSSLKSYPYNVRGNPSPNITWYQEDELLSSDMRLSRNDSGRYTLLASNVMGDTSCVTNITVEYAPIFNCPTNYEGKENDNFKDECLAAASPEAKVTWGISGRTVNPLHHLTRGDSGVYVITAVNKHGTVRHHLTVNVLYGPEIKPDRDVVQVKEGSEVSLNCTAEANPSPVVHWSFQNKPMATRGHQTTMTISKVVLADAGEYTCTATNPIGNDTRKVLLIVESVYPIKIDPDVLVVEFGASAEANCSVTSDHHGMGWEASQGAVEMVDNVHFIIWKVDSLTHWDILPLCYTNTDKQWTLHLNVTVYKRPDQVSISIVDHTGPMIEGTPYQLLCDVQNVAPVHLLNVNWYKGQQLVRTDVFSDQSKNPVSKTMTLQVSPQRGDDKVQYRCEAELELGPQGPRPPPRVASDPLAITVYYKPVINCLNWSSMINASLKSYPYNVRGNPSPNITWYREDELLSSDMRLSRNDSGRYTLLASNVMGDTSCVTNITVEYAPIFNCPTNYEGKENDNFKDECLAAASPEAKVTWEKSGRTVNPLHHLTRGDSGVYVITAVNKHGTVRHHLTVNVLHGPEIQQFQGFKVVIVGNDVSLNCTAIGNPVPEVKWSFQNQTKTTARRQTILQISDVKSENVGEYTCTATNTHGSQNATVFLTVKERQTGMISIILVLSIVFICIMLFIIYLYVKKKRSGKYNIQTNGTLAMSLLNHSHGKGTANS